MDCTPPCFACSMDHTYKVQRKTTTLNPETQQYDRQLENAMLIVMGANGQIESYINVSEADHCPKFKRRFSVKCAFMQC
jgi:hypothetical protein